MSDRFQSLIELSTDCFWELGADSRYTYVSPAISNILGYEPGELIGKRPRDFALPGEEERAPLPTEAVKEGQRPFTDLERIAIHKDGHWVLLTSSGTPLFDESGAFLGYRGFDRDITEQNTRLTEVIRISNELSLERSLDRLYRRAVEMGRERLGFDRLSIWMVTGPGWIRGTFGTDEKGQTRDESATRVEGTQQTQFILDRRTPYLLLQDTVLRNGQANEIGRGSGLSAAIWYGSLVSGVINADNYLGGRPFTSHDGEILALYASAIGHLIPRVQVEAKLRSIREIVGRVETAE